MWVRVWGQVFEATDLETTEGSSTIILGTWNMHSWDFYAIMCTERECTASEGHNVWASALALLKDMYDSLVVTIEENTFAWESWGLGGERRNNHKKFLKGDWTANRDAMVCEFALKPRPLKVGTECQFARIRIELQQVVTAPVVVQEEALPTPRW